MVRVSMFIVAAGFIIAAASLSRAQESNDARQVANAEVRHSDLSVYRRGDGTLAAIKSAEDWAQRRKQILAGMQEATGSLPSRDSLPEFDVRVSDDIRIKGVRRLTLTIATEGSDRLPLDLYLPETIADSIESKTLLTGDHAANIAAMVALHPTGEAGKRIVAGAGRIGREYGIELAQRGYVVVAPDYPSFGDLSTYDFGSDDYQSGTMKGIFNHMRCVDFLSAMKFVDPDRIGVIGHSLGGHNAIFLGVFDERVKLVVSSCGWCPFHDYYAGKIAGWTSDRYMPLLKTKYELNPDKVPFDFYELIASLAPRTFVSVSPVGDNNFDINGVRKVIPIAGSIYSLLGARSELILLTPDCDHDFPTDMRLQAYGVIDRVLKHSPTPFEPDYGAELPRISPTEPKDALATFHLADGFQIRQTASEPLVTDPVAMSFDADGRLFVAEMRDYSEQATEKLGAIRVLIDQDSNGQFDDSRIFAEGLSWPTAIICANDGVFVGAAPEILFLKDTDGDLKADIREVVFTGFGRQNVQGLINSLLWGPDNRIYGSASSTGGKITCPKHPDEPAIECRGRDFSFDPTTLKMRTETGGGQHGMSFDDFGHRFVSANSDHAQLIVYRDDYLTLSPLPSPAPARVSIAVDGGQAPVFRVSPVEPWRIVRTRLRASGLSKGLVEGGGRPAGYFTGATGITIYRGDAWPTETKGTAIIGDVGSNIVHRKKLTENGVAWRAERIDLGRELVASKDIWFRPVQFANAPDGCLHVLDMYRETIEHPASLPPEIKKHLDLTSGRDRGRLYRIEPANWNARTDALPGGATASELAGMLEHQNSWHRETAGRLIYERQDTSLVPVLRTRLRESEFDAGRFCILGALEGLGSLSEEDVIVALADSSPGVRERAVAAAETFRSSPGLLSALLAMTADSNARVRMQLAFSLGRFPASQLKRDALVKLLVGSAGDRWIRTAAVSSLHNEEGAALASLADNEAITGSDAAVVLTELIDLLARQSLNEPAWSVISHVVNSRSDDPALQVRILQTISAANKTAQSHPVFQSLAAELIQSAHANAADPSIDANRRSKAMASLSLSTYPLEGHLLLAALESTQPPTVQDAALSTLLTYSDEQVALELLERWSSLSPAMAEKARDGLLGRKTWAVRLLQHIIDGKLPMTTLTQADLQRLTDLPDEAVRSRAIRLLELWAGSSRTEILRSYQVMHSLTGHPERGAELFKQHCSSCHQVGNIGSQVGPSLATLKSRGPESILTNVLDPNREVNPAWRDYVAVTAEGTTHNGVLVAESASSLTLRRAEAKETSLLRASIETLRDTGRSLMPEGLEKKLDPQAMSDLIAWIMQLE